MSIRMRSEPISRQSKPSTSTSTRTRGARLAIVVSIAMAVLAGCSQGDASDAEQGKLKDAQRTAVVDGLQATESVRLLLPGTPAPTSTVAP